MTVSIRTRTADGGLKYETFDTDSRGQLTLDAALAALREAGNRITKDGDSYTVTDAGGAFVQRTEFRRSA